jgi:hypothetical protein
MKKLLLLSLCSLFLVSCGSDFLENEKSKHPERFYYHNGSVYGPWQGFTVKVYDGNKLINEYNSVRSVKTLLRGVTKIKLSDNNEIFIGDNYNIITREDGYCARLLNGDVICIPFDGSRFKDYGYFTDDCYIYDKDDYKEFYNIKD